MIYCISYGLHSPNRDYIPLISEIKKSGTWWHHLESTWFIDSQYEDEVQIRNRLVQHLGYNDELMVFRVGTGWATVGLPEKAVQWLNANWN